MPDKRQAVPVMLGNHTAAGYAGEVIIRLLAREAYPPKAPSVVLVAAHPDDEVLCAGSLLINRKDTRIIHVTDGAPRNMLDARAAGYNTRKGYAQARRRELASALGLASIKTDCCVEIGCVDQEASDCLRGVTLKLERILAERMPDAVVTHPYEGGHPDHDAAAFAVHAACGLLAGKGLAQPLMLEYASYHARGGRMVSNEFLPCAGCDSTTVVLSEAERGLKRRMMECFESQRGVLSAFQVEVERYRPAPLYDFTAPPHPGKLYYEHFDWQMTGARWRANAREALAALGLGGPI